MCIRDRMPAEPYKIIEAYDPASSAWSEIASLPDKHGSVWGGVLGQEETGKIYLIGGMRTDAGKTFVSKISNKMSAYDTVLGNWISCSDLESGRTCFGYAMLDKKIYVMGGSSDSGVVDHTSIYDTVSNQWRKGAAMPQARVHFQTTQVGGKIFAIGGKSPKGACDAVICYDPAGDSWTSSPGLSPLRTLTAQACVGSDIYVFGGTSSDESIVDSIDKFDTNTCTWSSGASLPFMRKQMMAIGAQ
eukprot:TRINITY_DN6199_c0_g1_i1.p1 TRINITY_DN6199_c0_g1~~TRINITY_DN6199_c0_g1_i1.p1  ORF type:complete len:245 (-),score=70.20 TRINITY_DN6199_c0_g1_i1:246-980(-)